MFSHVIESVHILSRSLPVATLCAASDCTHVCVSLYQKGGVPLDEGLTFEKYLEVMFSAIGCTLFFYNFGAGCDMHKAFESIERASVISALVILPVEYSHSTLASALF